MLSDETAASSLHRGIYESQNTVIGKQLRYFTRADGEPMTFAGLWDEWNDKTTGETLKSCTMIIPEPNDLLPRCMTACRLSLRPRILRQAQ
jgi:putative SOS response-associated peptidase YedK